MGIQPANRIFCFTLVSAIVLTSFFIFPKIVFAQQAAGPNIIDHRCTDISQIPTQYINAAKANIFMGYQHASHGRQPIEAMKNLDAFMGGTGLYAISLDGVNNGSSVLDIVDGYDNPGTWWYAGVQGADRITDSEDWVTLTRAFLNDPSHANINVLMWSWCNIIYDTGFAYNPDLYISRMESLISEYGPGGTKIQSGQRTIPVTFIFMTAHSNGRTDGANKLTFEANQKIRKHCVENNRILYDFFDLEMYNPDGEYYGDGQENPTGVNALWYGDFQQGCRSGTGIRGLGEDTAYSTWGSNCDFWGTRVLWGEQWQSQHTSGVDYFNCFCAHCQTVPILANQKAYAFWWLMAYLSGWEWTNSLPPGDTTPPAAPRGLNVD